MDTETQNVDVVILAGGVNRIPLFPGWRPGYKALLRFAGKPAIQYTLEAMRGVPSVRRIFVVGPETEIRQALAETGYEIDCTYVPPGDSPIGSVLNVLPYLKDGDGGLADVPGVLFATADLPLVTSASVQTFLDACAAAAAKSPYPVNIFLSAVLRRAFTGPFARSRKGHMTYREGAVYHGNLALIEPEAFDAPGLVRIFDRLYHVRKNPIASVLVGGWRIALSYIFGAFLLRLLSLDQMARIASHRLGVGIVPVRVDRPEIAIDVDEAGDYELVRHELERPALQP